MAKIFVQRVFATEPIGEQVVLFVAAPRPDHACKQYGYRRKGGDYLDAFQMSVKEFHYSASGGIKRSYPKLLKLIDTRRGKLDGLLHIITGKTHFEVFFILTRIPKLKNPNRVFAFP